MGALTRTLVLVLAVAVAGCAPSARLLADRALRAGELDRALTLLLAEESARPRDARVKLKLGVVLYESSRVEEALPRLRAARALAPRRAEAAYFEARAAEVLGLRDEALEAYGAYLDLDGDRAIEVQSRVRSLSRERFREEIRAALAREAEIDARGSAENTVAVLPFANVAANDSLAPLSRGLAALLISDLAAVHALRVLERERLAVLEQELALQGTPAPEARINRLLGARRLVQGSFLPLGATDLQLDADLLARESPAPEPAGEPQAGPIPEVLRLEKRLAYVVLERLGVAPTPEERRVIDRIPTRSLAALLAFGRGVDLEDHGRYGEAARAYGEAVGIDPGFAQARVNRDVLEVEQSDLDQADLEIARGVFAWGPDPRDRLLRSGAWAWAVPEGDPGSGGEGDSNVSGPNSVGNAGATSISVEGIIPRR